MHMHRLRNCKVSGTTTAGGAAATALEISNLNEPIWIPRPPPPSPYIFARNVWRGWYPTIGKPVIKIIAVETRDVR